MAQPQGKRMVRPRHDPMEFTIENAQLLYRNFEGRATRFKPPGIRTFSILLDPDTAKDLLKQGWNVKEPKVDDEGNVGDYTIQVEVGYKKDPPTVVMFTSKSEIRLGRKNIGMLDQVKIDRVDITCNAGFWEDAEGKTRVKAWLDELVVHLREGILAKKYGLNDILPYQDDDDEDPDQQ